MYDLVNKVIRLKPGRYKRISKAQKQLFMDIRRWAGGQEVWSEVIFPWSMGPKGAGYRYDIVVPGIKAIVEYDSIIHNKMNKHFHKTMVGFAASKIRDQFKNKMAHDAGYTMIRVNENDPEGGLRARRFMDTHRKIK